MTAEENVLQDPNDQVGVTVAVDGPVEVPAVVEEESAAGTSVAPKRPLTAKERSAQQKALWTPEKRAAASQRARERAAKKKAQASDELGKASEQPGGAAPTGRAGGAASPQVHEVHFLEDGLSVLGQVRYRGEELRIEEGSELWEATVDKNGHSWLHSTDEEQYQRYGKKMFGRGPWPFSKEAPAATDERVDFDNPDSVEDMKRREKAAQRAAVSGKGTSKALEAAGRP